MDTTVLQHTKQSHFNEAMQILWKKLCKPILQSCILVKATLPFIDNVQYVFEWLVCPAAALKPLARHKALLHVFALSQAKDDDKEKWQNSRREACCTLSIEGTMYLTHKVVTENIKYGPVYSIIPVKTINY